MSIDYKKYAIEFFNEYANRTFSHEHDYETDALAFIKTKEEFRKKDKLEADTLIMILEELNLLEFSRRNSFKRYHEISEEGRIFLNQARIKSKLK